MGRIKFGVYQTPKGNGGKEQACARLISRGTMRTADVCEYLSDSCSLCSSDIKGTIEALVTLIGRQLSNGYSVELEGLGYFSPALKTKQKTNEKGEQMFYARADGVNFRCSKRLKALVNSDRPIKVKRENIRSSQMTDRKNKMLKYLESNLYINLSLYAELNHCSRYRATEDMKRFVKEGAVTQEGSRTHRVYLLPQESGL